MVIKAPASFMLLPTITTLVISFLPTLILSENDTSYIDCAPFNCGDISFSFPFSSYLNSHCGLPGFQITCEDPSSAPKLLLSDRLYQVKNLFRSQSERLITLVDTQLIKELSASSCESFYNLSIANTSTGSLTLPPGSANLTFYKCPNSNDRSLSREFNDKIVNNISCSNGDQLYLWRNGTEFDQPSSNPVIIPSGCRSMLVPVSGLSYLLLQNLSAYGTDRETQLIINALNDGFPLEWPKLDDCERCQNRSGRCGYDGSSKEIVCFCKGGGGCVKPSKWKRLLVIAGVAIGSCAIVLVVVFIFRKRISPFFKKAYSETNQQPGDELNVKQFIKTYRSTLLTNHSYNDLKKMTNGFREKLGAGGYGNVYKGKFPDGRLVAVKMIFEKSIDTGHNFTNEVATIGRIHHVNIINLLSFCCDGSTRALIYEYMANGSLGDLLSREEACLSLGLVKLFEIAVAVAHAIEYLHNGCEFRILHLDIKPQNVLLDQDFNPKISDFGLAKVHSRNRSVVTMTGARGTIGYIAPEIFMRNLGSPSHKSDVYSYGMLLLEMIGGRKHLEPTRGTTSSSEAYFPDRIYQNLIVDYNLTQSSGSSLIQEEEVCITRKMAMVGLWCIQINPRDRPPMTKVLEMLSGNMEAIVMPPKPFFLSPSPVEIQNEITSIDSDTSELPLTYNSESYHSET